MGTDEVDKSHGPSHRNINTCSAPGPDLSDESLIVRTHLHMFNDARLALPTDHGQPGANSFSGQINTHI